MLNKHILHGVAAFLILILWFCQSDIENSGKIEGGMRFKITVVVVNATFIPVTALILIFLYCCRLLIDGILRRDAEMLLLWLIGSALFNAFLVYDVLTSQLILGNLTAAVLIMIWTSVLVLYIEFLKDDKTELQKQLLSEIKTKPECLVQFA